MKNTLNSTAQINTQLDKLSFVLISHVNHGEIGQTFNFDAKLALFIEGYLVSKKAPSLKIELNKFKKMKYADLAKLLSNLYFKATKYDYLGYWVNNGIVYIDLTKNILDLNEAIIFGQNNDQKAIWDCKNNSEITLNN